MQIEAYNEKQEKDGAPPALPFQLRLGSVKACRQSMTRVIREYAKGRVDESLYRALIWGLSQLITYWKLEHDLQIEKRIDELERLMEAKQ